MKNIFNTLLLTDIFQGLGVTLKYFFKKKVTYKYPYEKTPIAKRFRGIQYMKTHEDGTPKCVGCYLCQRVCPSECIHIETGKGQDGQRIVRKYEIDLSRCIYCGYCEEACPEDAIYMGRDFHLAAYSRDKYVINMRGLTKNYKKEREAEEKGETL